MVPVSQKLSSKSLFSTSLVIQYTSLKAHQTNLTRNIDSLHEYSDISMFLVNSTTRTLHTYTTPKTPTTTIVFVIHFHTPATTAVCPASPVD